MRAQQARRLLSALATIPFCVAVAQGQSPVSINEEAAAVTVTFFATDKHGNPIRGLDQSDISILDNGKMPQSIVAFKSAKDLPLRLGILIMNGLPWWEFGGEFRDHLVKSEANEHAAKAALDFLSQVLSGPEDKAFITTYATVSGGPRFMSRDQILKLTPDIVLPPRPQPRVHDRSVKWLFDAIVSACAVMESDSAKPSRRILIVLGETGFDYLDPYTRFGGGMSKASYSKALAVAQRAATTVLGDSLFAKQTGGFWGSEFYDASGSAEFFHNIKTHMDYMYSATFVPVAPAQPGHFRRFDLEVTSNANRKAHSQKGYYVPAAAQ